MSLSAGRLVYLTGKLTEIVYSFDRDIKSQIKIEINKQKINVTARLLLRAISLGFDLLFLKNIDFNSDVRYLTYHKINKKSICSTNKKR